MAKGDIRLRNFAKLVEENDGEFTLPLNRLVEKLILYESLVIESWRLKEIPILLQSLGYDSTIALLESGAIQIHSDLLKVGSKDNKIMHLLGYAEIKFLGVHAEDHFKNTILEIREDCDLTYSKFKKLEEKLNDCVSLYPEGSMSTLVEYFRKDVRPNSDYLKEAVRIKTKKELNRSLDFEQLEVNINRFEGDKYKLDSNLRKLLDIDKTVEYRILDSSLLSLGGLNERILQMELYNCISGFMESEIPIFRGKLNFLRDGLSSKERESELYRIIEIGGLPDLKSIGGQKDLNMEKLLEVRQEDEIVSFRNWLYSTAYINDQELEEMLNNFKLKLSNFLNTGKGKTLTLMMSTGIGAIPGIGQLLGAGLSLADTFLLNKLLKQPGAVTFISNSYPTIFQDNV